MRSLAIVTVAAMVSAPAVAQDVERYQLERTPQGYVRLDAITGKMSICEERGSQLVCNTAVEESRAHNRQFDDLQRRVDALEDRIAALEKASPEAHLPSTEEFEQTMGFMEEFFRRFMGIVNDLERDSNETGTDADRT